MRYLTIEIDNDQDIPKILELLKPFNVRVRDVTLDVNVFKRFMDIITFEAYKFVKEQDFGASFSNEDIQPFRDILVETEKPDFYFLETELNEILTQFLEDAQTMMDMIALNSVPDNGSCKLFGGRGWYQSEDKKQEIVQEVNRLSTCVAESYIKLFRICRERYSWLVPNIHNKTNATSTNSKEKLSLKTEIEKGNFANFFKLIDDFNNKKEIVLQDKPYFEQLRNEFISNTINSFFHQKLQIYLDSKIEFF